MNCADFKYVRNKANLEFWQVALSRNFSSGILTSTILLMSLRIIKSRVGR